MKKFIWLVTIAFALILGQPSFASSDNDEKDYRGHHRFDKLASKLELTPEQKAKIKAYKVKTRASMKENYTQLKALRSQINDLVKSDKIDETKLDNLIAQVNKIRGSMLKNRIMMQHKLYSLLTDKQKAKYQELKKKWEQRHH